MKYVLTGSDKSDKVGYAKKVAEKYHEDYSVIDYNIDGPTVPKVIQGYLEKKKGCVILTRVKMTHVLQTLADFDCDLIVCMPASVEQNKIGGNWIVERVPEPISQKPNDFHCGVETTFGEGRCSRQCRECKKFERR